MKILIVATPRSGSTTLCNTLGNLLNLEVYREPFVQGYKGKKYNNTSSHILKVMINQIDVNNFSFQIFDRIIYLSRKNIIEASQSFDYHLQHNKDNPQKWHHPYILEKSKRPSKSYQFLKESLDKLKELGDYIIYYEDLYSKDKDRVREIFNKFDLNVDFNLFYTLLNQKQRYRKYKQELI